MLSARYNLPTRMRCQLTEGCVAVLELCLRDVRTRGGEGRGGFAIQKQLEQCVSAVSGCCTCIPKNVLLTWKMQIYTERISHFALICMFTEFFSLWKKKALGFLLCREEHCFGNEQLFDNLLFCCLAVCALWLPCCFIIRLFLQEDCVVSLVPSSTVSELHL